MLLLRPTFGSLSASSSSSPSSSPSNSCWKKSKVILRWTLSIERYVLNQNHYSQDLQGGILLAFEVKQSSFWHPCEFIWSESTIGPALSTNSTSMDADTPSPEGPPGPTKPCPECFLKPTEAVHNCLWVSKWPLWMKKITSGFQNWKGCFLAPKANLRPTGRCAQPVQASETPPNVTGTQL